VTNLPMATARIVVAIYLRRWPVEICFKELKSGLGLGHAQVTKDAARVERSVAITLMAYLVVLCLQAKHIKPGTAWSVFALKQKFAWDVGAQQIKRTTQQETLKAIRNMKLAA
jgi:Transposase DDE domain